MLRCLIRAYATEAEHVIIFAYALQESSLPVSGIWLKAYTWHWQVGSWVQAVHPCCSRCLHLAV